MVRDKSKKRKTKKQPQKNKQWKYVSMKNAGPKILRKTENYLSEEPPPLPVSELEISGTISLDHFHCSQLLLSLGKGPTENDDDK